MESVSYESLNDSLTLKTLSPFLKVEGLGKNAPASCPYLFDLGVPIEYNQFPVSE